MKMTVFLNRKGLEPNEGSYMAFVKARTVTEAIQRAKAEACEADEEDAEDADDEDAYPMEIKPENYQVLFVAKGHIPILHWG